MEQMLETEVPIPGGPFTSDAVVSFGGEPATVILNNGSLIKVQSPGMSGEDIRSCEMADGAGARARFVI